MEHEFEYYLIGSDYKPNTPLLRVDDDDDHPMWLLSEDEPIANPGEPYRLCFNSPIPKKPVMTDYHSLPKSVVSLKIANVLEPLNTYGMQLIPAQVRNNNTNEIYPDYHIIYIYNKIECLDMKNATYKISESNGKVRAITKLVLDKEILSKIPLEKRMVFCLKEALSIKIYHKSLVDVIMAAKPDGVAFTPIEV